MIQWDSRTNNHSSKQSSSHVWSTLNICQKRLSMSLKVTSVGWTSKTTVNLKTSRGMLLTFNTSRWYQVWRSIRNSLTRRTTSLTHWSWSQVCHPWTLVSPVRYWGISQPDQRIKSSSSSAILAKRATLVRYSSRRRSSRQMRSLWWSQKLRCKQR